MKKNDWFILLGTAAYSFLFYEQSAGLNFLLFNLMLISFLLIRDRSLLYKPAWLAACAGSIVSAFFVFWWGTWLPILANLCSLLILEGFSFAAESSLLIAGINSCFSLMAALPVSIGAVIGIGYDDKQQDTSIFRKIPLFILPFLVTLVFFFIYRAANPVFEKFTDNINLDFINFEWLTFTVIGFILMFGFFRHRIIQWLSKTDSESSDHLRSITLEEHMSGPRLLSVSNELLTGIILFSLLNILLISVNALDIYCLWIAQEIPFGITVAEYLHDGTNTLIVSILMAIAIILFIFRGYLNFFENNRWLKILAYAWIAQNALLIITTAQRNWLIIESSGLTRRRIGVYVYLLLCLIGLVTTLIKVAEQKSNWFLFRKNAWAFYAVFILSCFFNWDDFIVNYNCRNFKALEFEYIDRRYQSELSYTSLGSLFKHYAAEIKETNPTKRIFTKEIVFAMYSTFEGLKKQNESASWKSWCRSKHHNQHIVDDLISKGEVEAKPELP